jgi:hypothetical protein
MLIHVMDRSPDRYDGIVKANNTQWITASHNLVNAIHREIWILLISIAEDDMRISV